MLAVVGLKQPAKECLTLGPQVGWIELRSTVTLGTIRLEDKGDVFFERLDMPGGKSPRHGQNPLLRQ